MMTERENALKVFRKEIPEWLPNHFDAIQFMGVLTGNETGMGDMENNIDIFGLKWIIQHGQPTMDHRTVALEDISDWRDVVKIPQPKTWNWEAIKKFEDTMYDPNKLSIYFCEQGMFDRLVSFMGFEEALCALITEPEECKAFFGTIADYKIELIECVGKYLKPDVFMYTDDIASATNLFMSPETYRELLKEHNARIIKAIHDNGMYSQQHTCGKWDLIADDYAEIGIQSIFPSQPTNDLEGMKEKYSNQFVICGGFNTQGECSRDDASPEVLRAEVKRMVDTYAKGGSYIAMPLVLGQSPNLLAAETENQKILYDAIKEYSEGFYQNPANC